MNIEKFVHKLIKKHGTNDPFIIAEKENIYIIYIKLGRIFGDYIKYKQIKFILIDKEKNPATNAKICMCPRIRSRPPKS